MIHVEILHFSQSQHLWVFFWSDILSLSGDIQDLLEHSSVQCSLGWPCLSREVRPDDPVCFLPDLTILWFSENPCGYIKSTFFAWKITCRAVFRWYYLDKDKGHSVKSCGIKMGWRVDDPDSPILRCTFGLMYPSW